MMPLPAPLQQQLVPAAAAAGTAQTAIVPSAPRPGRLLRMPELALLDRHPQDRSRSSIHRTPSPAAARFDLSGELSNMSPPANLQHEEAMAGLREELQQRQEEQQQQEQLQQQHFYAEAMQQQQHQQEQLEQLVAATAAHQAQIVSAASIDYQSESDAAARAHARFAGVVSAGRAQLESMELHVVASERAAFSFALGEERAFLTRP